MKLVNSYLENIEKNRRFKFGRKFIPEDSRNIHKIFRYSSINIGIRPKESFTSGSFALPMISIKKNDNSQINNNISFSISSEINIESMMNKKNKKINSGDKNYRYAENYPDYFKKGGLIVGITNRIRITDNFHKLRNSIYQTIDFNIKSLEEDKLWKSKVKQESDKNDYDYFNKLELLEKIYVKEDENKNNGDKNKGKYVKKPNIIINKNEKLKKKVKIK